MKLKLYILNLKDHQFTNNFQEEARKLRYDFFYKTMDEVNSNILLLAHHLNDDIETMLMRVIRGSNLKGYAGIEEYQKIDNKIIFRPLLKVLKTDIIEYAKQNNIKYFDDYTNFSDMYTRNRIRQHIIPELFKENENVHVKFLEYKDNINDASSIINNMRDEYINKLITFVSDGVSFKKDAFLNISEYMQMEILFEVLKAYSLSKKNIEELIKFISSDKKNLNIHYKSFTFVKEYNDIYLYFYQKESKEVFIEINNLGIFPINEKVSVKVSKKTDNFLTNLEKVWYNTNMFPFVIRTRKDGDKIKLDYGTKKIKKILIDNKIGISKRNKVLVLEKDDTIMAVFGYAKSTNLPKIENCDIVIEIKENENDN